LGFPPLFPKLEAAMMQKYRGLMGEACGDNVSVDEMEVDDREDVCEDHVEEGLYCEMSLYAYPECCTRAQEH
jgi:hypothetical protein